MKMKRSNRFRLRWPGPCRALGGVLGLAMALLAVHSARVAAETPVPAFGQLGKTVPVVPLGQGKRKEKEGAKTINIRSVRVVRGQVLLSGFDNRERPLPDGVYETSDGKRLGVVGGRIRFVTLPAGLASQGRSVAAPGGGGRGQGLPGASSRTKGTKTGSARRGRYRLTINGFTVHHETRDDALQLDGKHDEVYVTAQVAVVDRNRRIRRSTLIETKVMGDTNGHNGRVRAGSASRRGGIRTGDEVPGPEPWRRRGAPRGDRLPLAVWEGELVEGENSVVVIPVLWEHDGVRDAYRDWGEWSRGVWRDLGAQQVLRLVNARGKLLFDLGELKIGDRRRLSLQQELLGDRMDRPIGLKKETYRKSALRMVFGVVRGHGATVLTFSPKAVVLNYRTAELALKDRFGGRGRGVIAIRYKDHRDLEGDYTLYLQVQRL